MEIVWDTSDAQIPSAWKNLCEALVILSHGWANEHSPLYCTHDTLTVTADPKNFTPPVIEMLEKLGFLADYEGECFVSYRFGSA